jgi:hypothetical protein
MYKPSSPPLVRLLLAALALLAFGVLPLQADTVIVYSKTNTPATAINSWPPYQEIITNDFGGTVAAFYASSGNSSVQNPAVQQYGSRFGDTGYPAFQVQPTLAGTGHVYAIYCTLPNTATSPDETVEVQTSDGTLSTNKTLAFSDYKNGVIHGQCNTWNLIAYLTNNPGVYQPTVTFIYATNTIYGTNQPQCAISSRRFYSGPIQFDDITDQCKKTPAVTANAPLAAGQTFVNVGGVVAGATSVTVYANGLQIGKLASGVVAGVNTVPTSALVQGDEIKATQTTNNIEGCMPTLGPKVGGGANPEIRVSFILDQNAANVGPVGAPGITSGNTYHLPATDTVGSGYAYPPIGNIVLQPGPCWQTVSAQNGVDPESYFAAPTIMPVMPDPNPYAALVGISFCIENVTNTGPFNIYIDNIQSGDTVIQDFESATNGQQQVFLANPSTATVPVANLDPGLDISQVTTNFADTGTKSLQFSWQFRDASDIIWLRALCTGSDTPNPQIDLTKPLSMRVLLLPVGGTATDLRASALPNQTIWLGQSTSWNVTASGTPPFGYQWRFNGSDVADATSSTYSYNADPNLGAYAGVFGVEVAVTNATCSTIATATLTITNPVPYITNQPVHTIVHVGSPATLTVAADGHVAIGYPFSYQWYFNDAPITDGTGNDATLTIINAQIASAGSYYVTVQNPYGSTNSVTVTLDVVSAGVVSGNGTGLRAEYFTLHTNGVNEFVGAPTITRTDATVNFNWLAGSPDPLISTDYFTARWYGQVQALDTDTYTFYTTTDDGVRLWVNGQQLVNSWVLQGPTEYSGTIALTANTKYPILMEYFEHTGGAVAQLSWSSAGGGVVKEIVPMSQLYPGASLPQPQMSFGVANATNLVFSWQVGSYSLMWATNVTGPYTNLLYSGVGTYTYTNAFGPQPAKFFRLQTQ